MSRWGLQLPLCVWGPPNRPRAGGGRGGLGRGDSKPRCDRPEGSEKHFPHPWPNQGPAGGTRRSGGPNLSESTSRCLRLGGWEKSRSHFPNLHVPPMVRQLRTWAQCAGLLVTSAAAVLDRGRDLRNAWCANILGTARGGKHRNGGSGSLAHATGRTGRKCVRHSTKWVARRICVCMLARQASR